MSDLQLKTIIERILRLHAEEDEIKADRREVYAEAKSHGYDKTALGAAVSIIRKREKDAAGFEERNAIVDLYLSAFDGSSHAHAPARIREAEQNTSLGSLSAAQNEGAAGANPEQAAPASATGERSATHAQSAEFVTQTGAASGEGNARSLNAASAADAPSGRPKAAPIDLTIPAFLDRRPQPRPDA